MLYVYRYQVHSSGRNIEPTDIKRLVDSLHAGFEILNEDAPENDDDSVTDKPSVLSLRFQPPLITLKLEYASIGFEHCDLLCDLFRSTLTSTVTNTSSFVSTLRVLSLRGNNIDCRSVTLLSQCLLEFVSDPKIGKERKYEDFNDKYLGLQSLDLSCNQISDAGALAVAHTVGSPGIRTNLVSLNLSHNNITNACAKQFVGGLAGHNYMLKYLNISHNPIGAGAAALLTLFLRHPNHQIEVMNISHCDVVQLPYSTAMKEIADGVIRDIDNPKALGGTLRSLDISGNFVDSFTLIEFMKAVTLQHKKILQQHTVRFLKYSKKSFSEPVVPFELPENCLDDMDLFATIPLLRCPGLHGGLTGLYIKLGGVMLSYCSPNTIASMTNLLQKKTRGLEFPIVSSSMSGKAIRAAFPYLDGDSGTKCGLIALSRREINTLPTVMKGDGINTGMDAAKAQELLRKSDTSNSSNAVSEYVSNIIRLRVHVPRYVNSVAEFLLLFAQQLQWILLDTQTSTYYGEDIDSIGIMQNWLFHRFSILSVDYTPSEPISSSEENITSDELDEDDYISEKHSLEPQFPESFNLPEGERMLELAISVREPPLTLKPNKEGDTSDPVIITNHNIGNFGFSPHFISVLVRKQKLMQQIVRDVEKNMRAIIAAKFRSHDDAMLTEFDLLDEGFSPVNDQREEVFQERKALFEMNLKQQEINMFKTFVYPDIQSKIGKWHNQAVTAPVTQTVLNGLISGLSRGMIPGLGPEERSYQVHSLVHARLADIGVQAVWVDMLDKVKGGAPPYVIRRKFHSLIDTTFRMNGIIDRIRANDCHIPSVPGVLLPFEGKPPSDDTRSIVSGILGEEEEVEIDYEDPDIRSRYVHLRDPESDSDEEDMTVLGLMKRVPSKKLSEFEGLQQTKMNRVVVGKAISALRSLYRKGELCELTNISASRTKSLSSLCAKFWEGALGNPFFSEFTQWVIPGGANKSKPTAAQGNDNVIQLCDGITSRIRFCDAIYTRNIAGLQHLYNNNPKEADAIQTDQTRLQTFYHNSSNVRMIAEFLLSNLLSLQRMSDGLSTMCLDWQDGLEQIDKFLLSCAVFGYNDGEDLALVYRLKDFLLSQAEIMYNLEDDSKDDETIKQAKAGYSSFIELSRFKSHVCKLMLSRDTEMMDQMLADITLSTDDELKSLKSGSLECVACRKLLVEMKKIEFQLQEMLDVFASGSYVRSQRGEVRGSGDAARFGWDGSMDPMNEFLQVSAALKRLKRLWELIDIYTQASYYMLDNVALMKNAKSMIIKISQGYLQDCVLCIGYAIKNTNTELVDQVEEYLRMSEWNHFVIMNDVPRKVVKEMANVDKRQAIRNRLIKLALGIRNGFKISDSEAYYVMRKAKELGLLNDDSNLKSYFTTLETHVRKVAPKSLVVEEFIASILATKEYNRLATGVLIGKGETFLIMNCESKDSMNEWMRQLEDLCNGVGVVKSHSTEEGKRVVLFAGSMEKAARVEEDGILRNWKQRYFELSSDGYLTYYTKAHGEKKGRVRVLGGSVKEYRRVEARKSQGYTTNALMQRKFCIELREGIDLTDVDKDFLSDVWNEVHIGQQRQLCLNLEKGINSRNTSDILNSLKRAKEIKYSFPEGLAKEADHLLSELRKNSLLVKLERVIKEVPRGQLEILLRQAKTLAISPRNQLCMKAVALLQCNDIELAILRLRGVVYRCLQMGSICGVKVVGIDDKVVFSENSEIVELISSAKDEYSKIFETIQRFEVKRFTPRITQMLVAALIQGVGLGCQHKILRGYLLKTAVISLRQCVLNCLGYHVATEGLQLAKLLIGLADCQKRMLFKGSDLNDPLVRMGDVAVFADVNYHISKYPGLRVNVRKRHAEEAEGGIIGGRLQNTAQTGILLSTATGDCMGYTACEKNEALVNSAGIRANYGLLTKPLLKALKAEEPGLLEAYEVLLTIMGDRTIDKFRKPGFLSSSISGSIFSDRSSIYSIGTSLVVYGSSNIHVRDELYLHVCKQLRGNHMVKSKILGWKMIVIYLHFFAPSAEIAPYLYNCFQECYRTENMAKSTYIERLRSLSLGEVSDSKESVSGLKASITELELILGLADYCSRYVTHNINKEIKSSNSRRLTVSETMVKAILEDTAGFPVQFLLPTGAIARLHVKLSALVSLPALLQLVYTKCLNIDAEDYICYVNQRKDILAHYEELATTANKHAANRKSAIDIIPNMEAAAQLGPMYVEKSAMLSHVLKQLSGFSLYYYRETVEIEDGVVLSTRRQQFESATAYNSMFWNSKESQVSMNDDLLWESVFARVSATEFTRSENVVRYVSYVVRKSITVPQPAIDSVLPLPVEFANKIGDLWQNSTNFNTNSIGSSLNILLGSNPYSGSTQVALFGSVTNDNDFLQANNSWKQWVSDAQNSCRGDYVYMPMLLPEDFVRVDLLFAEESKSLNMAFGGLYFEAFGSMITRQGGIDLRKVDKYKNTLLQNILDGNGEDNISSGLSGNLLESWGYLLGLQLAMCWGNDEFGAPISDFNGEEIVMNNYHVSGEAALFTTNNPSIRPSHVYVLRSSEDSVHHHHATETVRPKFERSHDTAEAEDEAEVDEEEDGDYEEYDDEEYDDEEVGSNREPRSDSDDDTDPVNASVDTAQEHGEQVVPPADEVIDPLLPMVAWEQFSTTDKKKFNSLLLWIVENDVLSAVFDLSTSASINAALRYPSNSLPSQLTQKVYSVAQAVHNSARSAKINPCTNPRFRYMCKLAYLTYLNSWGLLGMNMPCYVQPVVGVARYPCQLRAIVQPPPVTDTNSDDDEENNEEETQSVKSGTASEYSEKSLLSESENSRTADAVMDEVSSNMDCSVFVHVSTRGFFVLERDDNVERIYLNDAIAKEPISCNIWKEKVVFYAALWDIEQFEIYSHSSNSKDASGILEIIVNGCKMHFVMSMTLALSLLETLTMVVSTELSEGLFPYGTSSDSLSHLEYHYLSGVPGAANLEGTVDRVTRSTYASLLSWQRPHIQMKYFMNMFVMLPVPPAIPVLLQRSDHYVPTPRSQREITAQKHAEAEYRETQRTKLAQQKAQEKLIKQMEAGRKKEVADDEDDEPGVVAGVTDAEERLHDLLRDAASGVPSRPSALPHKSLLPAFTSDGIVKLDLIYERVRVVDAPVLYNSGTVRFARPNKPRVRTESNKFPKADEYMRSWPPEISLLKPANMPKSKSGTDYHMQWSSATRKFAAEFTEKYGSLEADDIIESSHYVQNCKPFGGEEVAFEADENLFGLAVNEYRAPEPTRIFKDDIKVDSPKKRRKPPPPPVKTITTMKAIRPPAAPKKTKEFIVCDD